MKSELEKKLDECLGKNTFCLEETSKHFGKKKDDPLGHIW